MKSAADELESKGQEAKAASKKLARCSTEVKNRALLNIADSLISREEEILAANRQDYEKAEAEGMGTAMLKNLMKKKNVASLEEMIQMAAQLGVEFCICTMSMDLMGMKREEFIDYPHLEFCGVASFLAEASVNIFLWAGWRAGWSSQEPS